MGIGESIQTITLKRILEEQKRTNELLTQLLAALAKVPRATT
jgi:hypothetical protein